MTAHVETYDIPLNGEHLGAQLVSLPNGAEVVDAFMDLTGAVVLTVSPVRSSSRFVRTVFNHNIPAVLHVYVAPANEHTRRDVEHAARH